MNDETPSPPRSIKFKKDGTPDGRGHAEASRGTRFAAGDGRTRPGRKKGSVSLKTAYQRAAAMTAEYTDKNGKRHRVSTPEYIALKVRERAMKGDDQATRRFEDRVAEHFPEPVDPLSTADLLAEDAEILARAIARGTVPTPPADDGKVATP